MGILLLMGAVAMYIPSFVVTAEWWQPAITLAFAMGNAFFVSQLAYRSGLTRMPSVVPAFIYLITFGANSSLHMLWQGQLLLTVLLVALQLMQRTYYQEDATEESFLATLLFLLASFFWTDMVFFVVVWLLLLIVEEKIEVRAVGAILVALALAGVYCVIAQSIDLFVPDWIGFIHRHWIAMDEVAIYDIFLLGFTLYFIVASYLRINRDNISVQKYLQMITIVLLPILFCYVCSENVNMATSFLPAIVTMIASVYFLSTNTLIRGIVFLVYVMAIVGEFFINSVYMSNNLMR